jgi:hypothetical protein
MAMTCIEAGMLRAALDHHIARLRGIEDGVPPALRARYREVLHRALADVEASVEPSAGLEDRVVARVLARRAERRTPAYQVPANELPALDAAQVERLQRALLGLVFLLLADGAPVTEENARALRAAGLDVSAWRDRRVVLAELAALGITMTTLTHLT